jgi:hypothetical protein
MLLSSAPHVGQTIFFEILRNHKVKKVGPEFILKLHGVQKKDDDAFCEEKKSKILS